MRGRRRRQPPLRALRLRSSSRRTTSRWPAAWARRCGAPARRAPDAPARGRVPRRRRGRRGARRRRHAAAARQHDARARCAPRRARRRPRGARGQRRDRPWNVRGYAAERGTLHLGRGADALRPRARPLPPAGAPPMMPTTFLTPENDPRSCRTRCARWRASATPSSSPTTTSCPRSRTWPTTSATRSGSRARPRRAGGETIAFCGVHFMAETASILVAREDRAAARPRRRLLAGRLDHRRAAARLEGRAPRRRRRHVRQHDGRGQGARPTTA